MVKITIEEAISQLVHCYVEDKGSRFASFMTFVYGYNTSIGRKDIWKKLNGIHHNINEPWVILGDFNTGLSMTDMLD